MKTFYLIDASIYIFRAWFSIDDAVRDRDGQPFNAVYGFAHFLLQLLQREQPRYIAACFDESLTSSFRNRIYPEYKANRDPAPEELKYQFQQCKRLCQALGIRTFSSKRYEADDLIGTLAKRLRPRQNRIIVVSRDKDLSQLLQPRDCLWDFADDRMIGHDDVQTIFGVRPNQIADYLALAGDAVDNIPGVPGIGKKTAQLLLQHFDSLDGVYANLPSVSSLAMRGARRAHQLLDEHQQLAFLSRQLTTIKCDIPLKTRQSDVLWQPQPGRVETWLRRRGVGERLAQRFSLLW